MHETGHSKQVHWDNPEGWDGGRGVRDGEGGGIPDGGHMYTHGWFMLVYGKNHHNTVISLQLK